LSPSTNSINALQNGMLRVEHNEKPRTWGAIPIT